MTKVLSTNGPVSKKKQKEIAKAFNDGVNDCLEDKSEPNELRERLRKVFERNIFHEGKVGYADVMINALFSECRAALPTLSLGSCGHVWSYRAEILKIFGG